MDPSLRFDKKSDSWVIYDPQHPRNKLLGRLIVVVRRCADWKEIDVNRVDFSDFNTSTESLKRAHSGPIATDLAKCLNKYHELYKEKTEAWQAEYKRLPEYISPEEWKQLDETDDDVEQHLKYRKENDLGPGLLVRDAPGAKEKLIKSECWKCPTKIASPPSPLCWLCRKENRRRLMVVCNKCGACGCGRKKPVRLC